jgi:thioredoxin-related protein
MKTSTSLLICSIFFFSTGISQTVSRNFSQLDSLQKLKQKNIVVFIHTDWCSVCKSMQNSTFNNSLIKNQLDSTFYFIALHAEQEETIIYKGKSFNYSPTSLKSGIHELAYALGEIDGVLTYPTLVILSPLDEIILQYAGYLSATELNTLLMSTSN